MLNNDIWKMVEARNNETAARLLPKYIPNGQ